jgi:hypothetical protein
MDATGKTPGNFSLVGTEANLAACQTKCDSAGPSVCGVFDWNEQSGHCYLRYDRVWKPVANPRVTSCCLPSKVGDCGKAAMRPAGVISE